MWDVCMGIMCIWIMCMCILNGYMDVYTVCLCGLRWWVEGRARGEMCQGGVD